MPRTSEAQFKRNKYQGIDDAGNAPRHGHIREVGPPLSDVLLHKMAQCRRRAFIDVPAEWIDECCNEATESRETQDPEIFPIPPQQSRAAKHTNNQKTNQKTAMQIGPQDHDRGQQEAPRSLQTFRVENDAKQHRGRVWRSGEINIRRRRKGGIKQARGENGDANCNWRGSGAQADGGKISDDDCAACDDEQYETDKIRILKQYTGNHVPKPRQIEPLPGSKGE